MCAPAAPSADARLPMMPPPISGCPGPISASLERYLTKITVVLSANACYENHDLNASRVARVHAGSYWLCGSISVGPMYSSVSCG